MKRLTSDNTFEMNMHQLALNQVYVGKDGWVQYVEGPDRECSVCDLVRAVSETLGVELPMLSDEALSDLMLDWLQYGAEEPEGVVAILYRALCAMAEVRAQLFRYEDTGLEPEEIEAAKERIDIKFALWVSKTWGLADGRLNEILKAEKDGRLVVLPYKIGDLVYRIAVRKKYLNHLMDTPYIKVVEIKTENALKYKSEIGKTVFLTREEAEAALKEVERVREHEGI